MSPFAAAFGKVTRPRKCHKEGQKTRENRNRRNPGVLHLFLVKRKGRVGRGRETSEKIPKPHRVRIFQQYFRVST